MLGAGDYFLRLPAVMYLNDIRTATSLKNFSCLAMETPERHTLLRIGRDLYGYGLTGPETLDKFVHGQLSRAAILVARPLSWTFGFQYHENTDCYL